MTYTKSHFIFEFNKNMPKWKRLTPETLNGNLFRVINTIVIFIEDNNLKPRRLVKAVVTHHYEKTGRYPTIFSFTGIHALTLYKNYKISNEIELDDIQKILISVKKSEILLRNIQLHGIVISKGIRLLEATGKLDYYFLLAYGLRDTVPKEYKIKWDRSATLQKMVVDILY